jgi:GT2 family glycosyltransferase
VPPIIALVSFQGNGERLASTLASLASENVEAIVIGPDAKRDLFRAGAEIDLSQAAWLMPMAAGDCLAPGAARAYRKTLSGLSCCLVYADDDLLGQGGVGSAPYFKPEWNPELIQHHDFLTGACILRADLKMIEAVANTKDWAQALVARALFDGGEAIHLAEVLHHRVARLAPRLPLAVAQIAGGLPTISIIVPTRNQVELLSTCIEGISKANYSALEIIVVDNDSDDPAALNFLAGLRERGVQVLHHSGPFNYSAINNRAIARATGELICLLNNDIEMISPDWLAIMATQAMRKDVGAVGAQLLYPDGRLQHAGVVIGVGNAAGHAHRLLRPEDEGYFHRHALPQFVSAVTAACLVVKRERFLAVGGLDEQNFAVAYNDVDLCLKLNQRGWQSFYEPRAVLIHHESVSRGLDVDPVGAARFAGELAALKRIWKTDQIVDPYHHPHLSRASEQFAVAL